MKKIFIMMAVSTLVVSCENNSTVKDSKSNVLSADVVAKYESVGYKNQLPYITISDGGEQVSKFCLQKDWDAREMDNSVTWIHFDAEYKESQPIEVASLLQLRFW